MKPDSGLYNTTLRLTNSSVKGRRQPVISYAVIKVYIRKRRKEVHQIFTPLESSAACSGPFQRTSGLMSRVSHCQKSKGHQKGFTSLGQEAGAYKVHINVKCSDRFGS